MIFIGRVEWRVARAAGESIVICCVPRAMAECLDVGEHGIMWVEPCVVVNVDYAEMLLGRRHDAVLRQRT